MYWLDNNTGISTAPAAPAVISLTKRFFTNGGAGEQPSIPEDFWFNMIQEELLGVLTMAGIAPVKNDLGQLAKAIRSIAFSAYPIGAPIPWPLPAPPAGFLLMNGQTFYPPAYPDLALAYPSGVLPDLRGESIRGWDNSRGIDSGRAILSQQLDAMQNVVGSVAFRAGASSGLGVLQGSVGPFSTSFGSGAASNTVTGAAGASVANDVLNFNLSSSGVRTAAETRARNIAFNYIVRGT